MKPRLLIVDDLEVLRMQMREWLKEDFDIVAEAVDGLDALRLWKEHRPELVLMDVAMPNANGIEAARAIIEEGKAQGNAPYIVMLSGIQDESIVFQAFEAGAIDYLFKPARREELIAILLGYYKQAV